MDTILVTGASRGLGRETAEALTRLGHVAIFGVRRVDPELPRDRQLQLDVTDPTSVQAAVAALRERFGRLDALVNNAGVLLDGQPSVAGTDLQTAQTTFETNVWGPWRLVQALLPLLRQSPNGRIVNVSSGMGALTDIGGGHPAYRLSKASLNALTRILAVEEPALRVNAVCPGWVHTDMGGPRAPRTVPQGAAGIVWAATLPADGPTGGFFRDGKPIDW